MPQLHITRIRAIGASQRAHAQNQTATHASHSAIEVGERKKGTRTAVAPCEQSSFSMQTSVKERHVYGRAEQLLEAEVVVDV